MIPKIRNKVLIIENAFDYTGAFKSINLFSEELSDEFEISFAINETSKIKAFLEARHLKCFFFRFIELQKSWKLILYLPVLIWNSFKLLAIIKKEKIDIVHVNDLYNMMGVIVKMLNPKIKLIYHVRLLPNSYLGPLYYLLVRLIVLCADYIICVSETVATHIPHLKNKIVIFDSIPSKEKHPPKDEITKGGKIKILYLGNLIKGKGQDLALKAFSKAVKATSNLTLTFVGGNTKKQKNAGFFKELMDLASYLGVHNSVKFIKFTSDVEKLIKEYDIALNLSESESFSMVCLEALYYGTPLVASDCGGPRELFENGKSGILVPNRDIDAAAEAIINLAEVDGLRKLYGIEGKKFVRQKFHIERTSTKLRSVYKSLLQRNEYIVK